MFGLYPENKEEFAEVEQRLRTLKDRYLYRQDKTQTGGIGQAENPCIATGKEGQRS